MSYLELDGLVKTYGEVDAVRDFNLSVDKGEFVSLLGPSGCGKTTTLRIIAGFETPNRGTVRLAGEEITGVPPHHRGMGMVFQSYALFPNMTAWGNVAFGLRVDQAVRQPHQPEGHGTAGPGRSGRRQPEVPGRAKWGTTAAGRPGKGAGDRAQGPPA